MGLPRQGYWSGLLFPSARDLRNPEIKPESPSLAGFYHWATMEAPLTIFLNQITLLFFLLYIEKKESLQYYHWKNYFSKYSLLFNTNIYNMISEWVIGLFTIRYIIYINRYSNLDCILETIDYRFMFFLICKILVLSQNFPYLA